MMKEKIISVASDLFLKLGFKSITMDDIATEMGISKKTIYKYFPNKETLIQECSQTVRKRVYELISSIVDKKHNAIQENFEIRRTFKDAFQSFADTSPIYQLRKYYPKIYFNLIKHETDQYTQYFKNNIAKGIKQKLYREDINIDVYVKFYYTLIFHINENTSSEKETQEAELEALEYHIRAMATPAGIIELEKQIEK